jgi:DNA polymerase II small subunit
MRGEAADGDLGSDEISVDDLVRENIPKETKREIENLREALRRTRAERSYRVPITTENNKIDIGVVSDIHAGSLYTRWDALRSLFKYFRTVGVKHILIAGDVLDGHGMYKGQEFEQHAHGIKKQLDELEDHFPDTEGLSVYFITGNHDYSFDRMVSVGIGELISRRMGWKYAGRDYGDIDITAVDGSKLHIALMHPSGGTAYAISYRSQKIVEQIPGGKKPDILIIGHFHKAEILPRYRNVYTIQAGCFQSQTPYMRAKPTDAHVGGWVLTATPGRKETLTSKVAASFISYYEPLTG